MSEPEGKHTSLAGSESTRNILAFILNVSPPPRASCHTSGNRSSRAQGPRRPDFSDPPLLQHGPWAHLLPPPLPLRGTAPSHGCHLLSPPPTFDGALLILPPSPFLPHDQKQRQLLCKLVPNVSKGSQQYSERERPARGAWKPR